MRLVSAGAAFVWATDLYDCYAWWFRVGGLLLLVALVVWLPRRRNQCSPGGVRENLAPARAGGGVAGATYVVLYANTWLGTLA
jgi:hypothetical protein